MTNYIWSMDKKYITRRRWAFAIALVLAVFVLIGLYQLVSHIWWVEGQGYCWGTLEKCFPREFGG
jgi:hypothetical protein